MVKNGEGTSPILRVYRRDEDGSETNVTFTLQPTCIKVQAPRSDQSFLYPIVDAKLRTCLLMDHASKKCYKVWELSQATLGPLLFT